MKIMCPECRSDMYIDKNGIHTCSHCQKEIYVFITLCSGEHSPEMLENYADAMRKTNKTFWGNMNK